MRIRLCVRLRTHSFSQGRKTFVNVSHVHRIRIMRFPERQVPNDHIETMPRWARKGVIPAAKLGNRAGFRFRREDLDHFLERRRAERCPLRSPCCIYAVQPSRAGLPTVLRLRSSSRMMLLSLCVLHARAHSRSAENVRHVHQYADHGTLGATSTSTSTSTPMVGRARDGAIPASKLGNRGSERFEREFPGRFLERRRQVQPSIRWRGAPTDFKSTVTVIRGHDRSTGCFPPEPWSS